MKNDGQDGGATYKEKAQHKTKWNRRFHIALIATMIVANLYFVVDSVATNRTTRALNQQMSEVNQRWSNIIDRIQERLDGLILCFRHSNTLLNYVAPLQLTISTRKRKNL